MKNKYFIFILFIFYFYNSQSQSTKSKIKIKNHSVSICKSYDLNEIYDNIVKFLRSNNYQFKRMDFNSIKKIETDTTEGFFYCDSYLLCGFSQAYSIDDVLLSSGYFISVDNIKDYKDLYKVIYVPLGEKSGEQLINYFKVKERKDIVDLLQKYSPFIVNDQLFKSSIKLISECSDVILFNIICNTEFSLVRMKFVYIKDTVRIKDFLMPFVMDCEEWAFLNKELQKRYNLKLWNFLGEDEKLNYYYDFKDAKALFLVKIIYMEILTKKGFIKLYSDE